MNYDPFGIGWFERSLERGHENEVLREKYLDRLRSEPCMKTAEVGDMVLVSAGLIGGGCGFMHELVECLVTEVADTSYKIQFSKSYDKEPRVYWVPSYIVTDVIKG